MGEETPPLFIPRRGHIVKNTLDRQKFYALTQWVLALSKTQNPIVSNYTRLAQNAGRDLSIAIPPSAVKDAIEATGVNFVQGVERAKNLHASDRIVRLSHAILGVIESLESGLGNVVPNEIKTEIKMLAQRKGKVNVNGDQKSS